MSNEAYERLGVACARPSLVQELAKDSICRAGTMAVVGGKHQYHRHSVSHKAPPQSGRCTFSWQWIPFSQHRPCRQVIESCRAEGLLRVGDQVPWQCPDLAQRQLMVPMRELTVFNALLSQFHSSACWDTDLGLHSNFKTQTCKIKLILSKDYFGKEKGHGICWRPTSKETGHNPSCPLTS